MIPKTYVGCLVLLSPGHFSLDLFDLFHYTHLEGWFGKLKKNGKDVDRTIW